MRSVSSLRRDVLPGLALAFAIVLVAYSVCWVYYVRRGSSGYLGIEQDFRPATADSLITRVAPDSPAARAGLAAGDRLLAVNGRRLVDQRPFWDAVPRGRAGARVVLAVARRDGTRAELVATLVDARVARSAGAGRTGTVVSGTRFVTAQVLSVYPLVFLGVALFVLAQKTHDRSAWLLALMFAGYIAGAPVAPLAPLMAPALRVPMFAASALFGLALPGVFNYFFATFPAASPLDRRCPWLKHLLLWPSAAFGVLLGAVLLVGPWRANPFDWARVPPSGPWSGIVKAAEMGYLTFVVGCYVLGLASLVLNAFASDPDIRRRTRVMLWGTLAAVVPMTAVQIYAVATGRLMSELPFWVWAPVVLALFLLPLSFAYAVVRHRVMEIPVLLRRSARYLLVRQALVVFAGLVAVASTFAFARLVPWLAGSEAPDAGSTPIAAVAGAGFGAVLAVAGGRVIRRGTERIDRAFFRGAYDARRILHELAARCRTASDPWQLAGDVRRALDDAFHAQGIHVILRTPSGGLVPSGTPPDSEQAVLCVADAADLRALFGGGAVRQLTPPFQGAPAWLAALGPELVVALEGRDEHLEGLIALEPRLSEEPYSREDRDLLGSVASQAGIALENIRLAREMVTRSEAERRVNLELAIAKQVQARLLPRPAPGTATLDYAGVCVQAREVGGDYFDFVQVDEGRLALVLADIAGKGISAALLMASLQAMLRARATQSARDLPGMLRDVNQVFYDSTAANNYATLFFGIFDERDRTLTYANCGHLPPVLHRAHGRTERLGCTATVMGLFSPWPCAASVVTLDPGDTLVVFTDGATDALDASGNEFGEERVLDLITRHVQLDADALLQAIVRDVQAFSGPQQYDDLTLLVAKVRG